MKQELLIAIALLATGSVIWIWQNGGENANQTGSVPTNARAVNESNQFGMLADQSVTQAAWPNDSSQVTTAAHYIEEQESESLKAVAQKAAPPRTITLDCPEKFRVKNADPTSANVLRQLSVQITEGQPIQSTFKMQSYLFDVELQAEGRFWQIGQGSQKSRMELAINGQSTQRNILQICDGRFVFQVKQFGNEQKIEFVDLQRLKNSEAHLAVASLPGAWVGRGSLAGLFNHLADAFKFNPPVVSQTEFGENIYSIRGHWKPERLYQILVGVVKKNKLEPVIQLDELPPQLPHAVNVIVKKAGGDSNRMIPVQVEFYRFAGDESNPKLKLLLDVSFERFEVAPTLDGRLFSLQSSDGEAVDMTDVYNRKLDKLVGDQGRVADVFPVIDGQSRSNETIRQ